MADVKLLTPKILQFEGGYVNDPTDRGGATNMGITLKSWQAIGYDKNGDGVIDESDIKLLICDDFTIILKKYFWDKWHADDINSQGIAEILVDWVWGSWEAGFKRPQKILGVVPDGLIGSHTIAAINNHPDPQCLFNAIQQDRLKFIDEIIADHPEQIRFEKGWKNRILAYQYC